MASSPIVSISELGGGGGSTPPGSGAPLRQDRDHRLTGPELREVLLEVVVIGLRVRRDRSCERLRVAGREGPQRVLHPVAELGEDDVRHVVRQLGDEEDAHALRADQPDGPRHLVEELLVGVVEQQVRLVEEEHELRLVEVPLLRQVGEQLGQQPHEEGAEQRGLVLHRGQLEQRHDAPAVGRRAEEVGDGELRLAEERGAPLVLELEDVSQQDPGGGRREPAERLELRLALVAGQVGEHGPEVTEVDEVEPASAA
jgi:hypothetical protein